MGYINTSRKVHMVYMNLENLSNNTLVSMIGDLTDSLSDAQVERENRDQQINDKDQQLSDWQNRFYDMQDKCSQEQYRNNGSEYKREAAKFLISASEELTDDQALLILGLVSELGSKIHAIKAYRQRTKEGLMESKEAIEQWRTRVLSK